MGPPAAAHRDCICDATVKRRADAMALFNSLESWVDLIDFDFHYSNLINLYIT